LRRRRQDRPAIVPASAAWPAWACQQVGEVALFAAHAPARRRRSTACRIGIWRSVFRPARCLPVLRRLGRAWFCRACNLAHDISALIINQNTYNIGQ
jgi:hypothetical protein